MEMTTRQINARFPETMSSTMLMKALGVSGKKMHWILEHGYIPHQHSDRKTHCYAIARADVIAYLKDRKKHPEKYPIPDGYFSARGIGPYVRQRITEVTEDPVVMRKYLRFKWKKIPKVLRLSEAATILGYNVATLRDWRGEGFLQIFSNGGTPMVTKDELIHCVAMRKIQMRPGHSEKHKKLMDGFGEWKADRA